MESSAAASRLNVKLSKMPFRIGVWMKLARVLLLGSVAAGLFGQTATWDTSGNGMLNGKYYFRQVAYALSAMPANGSLSDAVSLYGTVTFDGIGGYTMAASVADGASGQLQSVAPKGTYSISAAGQGWITSALSSTDLIYGTVNAQGIFVASSTENVNGYQDMFIAAPLASPAPTASTFKGSYTLAYISFDGNPLDTIDGMLQMNPDGGGNLGTVGFTEYVGQGGATKFPQSLTNVKYIFSNGAAVVTFPNVNGAAFAGQYYLYFSPDGNFVFGGNPGGFDMFVGVRTGTGTPSLSGLYYEAGLDQDESTLSAGYAAMDSFYGAWSATSGAIVGHERLLNVLLNGAPINYTYSDGYTLAANGTYSTPVTNYVVSNGIRIGSGIGPFLGLSVGLQAPAMSPSLSTTGVFVNPTGVVNAGSSAPFTAGLAPGELLLIYGAGLASGIQVASAIPFPTTLGNVQVMINGIPAPIYYVTPTQLSAIVPYGVSGTVAKVQVFNNNVPSNAVTSLLVKTAPGVLTQLQNGLGYGDAIHQDGTLVNDKNPAQIGETVSVFLTGLGAVSPTIADGAAGPLNPFSNASGTIDAFIGGVTATVGYAGLAPQLAGLYQINLTVPSGVTPGDNALDIAGPDSYTSVCLISIASPPGTVAVNPAEVSSVAVSPAAPRPVGRAVPSSFPKRGAIVPVVR
jgi:uncharacterized protein (TIGR03437 family)